MKIESSSFVVSKKELSKDKKDIIIDYSEWYGIFIKNEDDINIWKYLKMVENNLLMMEIFIA